MQINIQEIEYCKLQVQYEADTEKVSNKKDEIVKRFKSYRVPGFRPNKATNEAVRIHYSKEIYEALKKELIENAFHDVISEKQIKPFGMPDVINAQLENLKFTCEFYLNKQPDFELAQYKGFEIPKFSGYISEEELVQRMLQDLRTKYGTTTPYGEGDFVQMGDSIIIDYSGSLDDVPIDKLTATGEIISVGRVNIPNFSENLLGMNIGEKRDFILHIPNDYPGDFAGKDVKFSVSLTMGSKMQPAPLDDSLAKQMGLDTFELLNQSAYATASSRVKELEKGHYMDQISRRLVAGHDFKIPELIALAEAQTNAQNSKQNWETLPDADKEKAIQQSSDNIKLSLILIKIRENEPDSQLTDEEVFETAKTNLSKYTSEPNKVMAEMFKNGQINVFFNRIRDEATLSFVEKNSTIIE